MHFVVFWEYDPDELENVIKRLKEFNKEIKKNPKKYPKMTFGPYLFAGESKGINACIIEDEEQPVNFHLYFQAELKMSFVPIVEVDTAFDLLSKK
ncbi:MAG: hypothetical protein KAJ76_05265 [Candidatus Heimdallarchaeota archaeon]|nr:hypothetical protein [Candidatus Heimdallarchaeota archaeon]